MAHWRKSPNQNHCSNMLQSSQVKGLQVLHLK
jgi:hypothetical protein